MSEVLAALIRHAAAQPEKRALIDEEGALSYGELLQEVRITSYNVCYTKLLRLFSKGIKMNKNATNDLLICIFL